MQQTFLSEVAQKLYSRYGEDISSLTLVFPSRRARLFFSDSLSEIINKPIWQPSYISIDDLMHEASSIEVGEKILLISELYKIYKQHHPAEQFDKFYFWGEILLNDFDLIDKYMIDADMLFSNINDIKELEADLSYLTEDMLKAIATFWSHFSADKGLSEEKKNFLGIWKTLAPIYHAFHARMEQMQIGYAGKVYRSAASNIESDSATLDLSRHYVFIGFNALSECEKRLLKYLNANCECDFFWDYDNYYTSQQSQEAGRFLRENLKLFPPTDEITHNNFLDIKKQMKSIAAVSNALQCKYVNTLLREISDKLEFDKRTAIVLTDESLLMPLLHALPAELKDNVNVTMGYPLRQTTAYSFIERLIELQRNCRTDKERTSFYHVDATGILSHPYIIECLGNEAQTKYREVIKGRLIRVEKEFFSGIKLLETIFSPASNYIGLSKYLLDVIAAISEYESEDDSRSLKLSYLSIIATNISELDNCINKCDIEISTATYISLLRRHLQTVRIPFSGEPLKGLQIMGILETRNLDFENVIILSMNDDNFPGSSQGTSSFIPYNLRAAYGIPTPEHHEGVYAYYFYRLIQRAKRVDMLYCSHADEKSTGEQSRYIYQLDFESPYSPQRINVGVDVAVSEPTDNQIEKSGNVLAELERFTADNNKKLLSPSAFSRYIDCPMKFYLSAIAKLKRPDELNDDMDNMIFGNILHEAMEHLYESIIGIAHPAEHLKRISNNQIEEAVVKAINNQYLNNKNARKEDYTGQLILVKQIISKYISQGIIPYDIAHDGFALMNIEEEIFTPITLDNGKVIKLGGRADRIDSLDNGMIRVVDYKTGGIHSSDKKGIKAPAHTSIEGMFNGEKRSNFSNILQTLIYSKVLHDKLGRNVQPNLYYARYMLNDDFSPIVRISTFEPQKKDPSKFTEITVEADYNTFAEEFEARLKEKLNELFDPTIPFVRCPESESSCSMCDFKNICKR